MVWWRTGSNDIDDDWMCGYGGRHIPVGQVRMYEYGTKGTGYLPEWQKMYGGALDLMGQMRISEHDTEEVWFCRNCRECQVMVWWSTGSNGIGKNV